MADANFYCYFVKTGTPIVSNKPETYTIKATPHFHRNIEFLFITKGEQRIIIDGNAHILNEGDILFVNSYQPHSYDESNTEAFVLVLSSTYFEPFRWFFGSRLFPQIMDDKEKNKVIFDFIKSWYEDHQNQEKRYDTFIKSNMLFQLIISLYQIEEPVFSRQNELVISALKYINEHYHEYDLTLKSCSNAIGYSKEYVSKQFNNVMGVSFKGYVNNLRIKKYRELSKKERKTKQELALMCGFKSVATFYRALNSSEEDELGD